MYRTEIVYDRTSGDYTLILDGETIGFASTYHDAEITLDQLVNALDTNACAGFGCVDGCADCDALATAIVTTMVHRDMQPVCADPTCQGPHHIQQCPQIKNLLFADLCALCECDPCDCETVYTFAA